MQVFYTSDNEPPSSIDLDELLVNFKTNRVKHYYADDIINDLMSRGWYEGAHDLGRYLILNLDKLGLIEIPK